MRLQQQKRKPVCDSTRVEIDCSGLHCSWLTVFIHGMSEVDPQLCAVMRHLQLCALMHVDSQVFIYVTS